MHYQRKIKLEETDATGVIFFAKLPSIALELLEIFLNQIGYSIPQMMEMETLFPIVHVKANYLLPMRCSDLLDCHLYLKKVGESSVTFYIDFFLNDQLSGNVELVNVWIDKCSFKSKPLSAEFKSALKSELKFLNLSSKISVE